MQRSLSPNSRKIYPNIMEVDRYLKLVSMIDSKRNEIKYERLVTLNEKIKNHYHKRNNSVINSPQSFEINFAD